VHGAGHLAEFLPSTKELVCDPNGDVCRTTFPWVASLIGALALMVMISVAMAVPGDKPPPPSPGTPVESGSPAPSPVKLRRRRSSSGGHHVPIILTPLIGTPRKKHNKEGEKMPLVFRRGASVEVERAGVPSEPLSSSLPTGYGLVYPQSEFHG
jgi:hypothetical protein